MPTMYQAAFKLLNTRSQKTKDGEEKEVAIQHDPSKPGQTKLDLKHIVAVCGPAAVGLTYDANGMTIPRKGNRADVERLLNTILHSPHDDGREFKGGSFGGTRTGAEEHYDLNTSMAASRVLSGTIEPP